MQLKGCNPSVFLFLTRRGVRVFFRPMSSEKPFENKVAIVTGGSRGIGRAIVQALAREGAKVAFTYVQNKAQADEVANGDTVVAIQADVVDFERAKALVKEVKERFGRIDILVNNAGITRDKLIALMSEKDWDDVMDTNLKGIFNVTKHAAVVKDVLA